MRLGKYILPLFFVLMLFAQCRKDIDYIVPEEAPLTFSTDSVKFDTIFTRIGSATRNFKIKNISGENVRFDNIRLAGGSSSPYRINIDGRATTEFKGFELDAGDSAYIFVEVTIDPNNQNLPFVVTDSVVFETGKHRQRVVLESFGQNAIFLRNEYVTCNTVWDSRLPYVLTDVVAVAPGCKLTIREGTKIYAHRNALFWIQGTLEVKGTKDQPVIFKTDRPEAIYASEPGQWFGIRFNRGSTANVIEHAWINNATVGIQVDSLSEQSGTPNLRIEKTIISNSAAVGLLGYTAQIDAKNLLVYSSGQANFAGELGGTYHFTHCTFENTGNSAAKRSPSISLSNANYKNAQGQEYPNKLTAEFRNCIIWGSLEDEVKAFTKGSGGHSFVFEGNLMKAKDFKPGPDNILNKYPGFKDPGAGNYRLDSLSPAINAGKVLSPPFETLDDLDDKPRDGQPDIGCYER